MAYPLVATLTGTVAYTESTVYSIASATLQSISVASNIAVATTGITSSVAPGSTVVITGATFDSDLNGTYTVSSAAGPANTFSFTTASVTQHVYSESTLVATVYTASSTLLDGSVLLLLAFPTGYSSATIANQLIPQPIGDHVKVRIQQGVYDQSARIYYNSCLEPPNTQYVAYFYDNNDIELGHTSLFTISSSPYTITVPLIIAPAATTVIPAPGGGVLSVLPSAYWYPTSTPADSSRTTFLFPFSPNVILWNGTVQFLTTTVSGFTLTFNGTSYVATFVDSTGMTLIPSTGDVIIEGV